MKAFKLQLKLLFRRKTFAVALAIMMIFAIGMFIYNCAINFGRDILSVKAAKYLFLGSAFEDIPYNMLSFVFPIVAALPFADTFFEERANKTVEFCISRLTNKQYYFSKMAAVFFSGFIIGFIPLMTNFLLNFVAFPLDSSIDATNFSYINSYLFEDVMQTGLFQTLFAQNMYLYNLVYLFLFSIVCGLSAVIVFQFSFFYKKSRILLICSFFGVYNFLNIPMWTFGAKEFCLPHYIFAADFYSGQSLRGMIVVYALIIAAAFLPTPFALKRLKDFYD